jgi:hypothetical protein
VQTAPGKTVATAMQLAIALLNAGLDPPDLEAWAADTLTPIDADGLGDFMVGLHAQGCRSNWPCPTGRWQR